MCIDVSINTTDPDYVFFYLFLFYVYDYFAFLYVSLWIPHVPGAYGGQTRASDPWELELVGHCYVGVVN